MQSDRELMQMALDALEYVIQSVGGNAPESFDVWFQKTQVPAEALRARLAEPEQLITPGGGLPNDHNGVTAAQPEPEPEVRWDASSPLVVHPHPAFQATQPQQHSEQWWRHEVSNAWAEGYEKGRVFCGCGDQIMPNDGAECGNCVAARNAVKNKWKWLTEEEIDKIANSASSKLSAVFLAESQLRGKNAL